MNVLDDAPAQSPGEPQPKLRDFHIEDILNIIGKLSENPKLSKYYINA
jgi:hypothetical protein